MHKLSRHKSSEVYALGRHLHVLHHIYIIVEHWICRDMHFPQNDVVSDLTETMAATIHTVFVGMWILVKAEETPGRSVCFEYGNIWKSIFFCWSSWHFFPVSSW